MQEHCQLIVASRAPRRYPVGWRGSDRTVDIRETFIAGETPERPVLPAASALNPDDRASAERVLRLAADGMRAIADTLGDNFAAVLDLFQSIPGRVIVTGMGKSGHIGHKIAATLASTGTPSFFVHPGEASHGDLGMITRQDAVLALSNSGNTHELSDVIAYTRRFGIPLVGMTRQEHSTLAEACDILLLLPPVAEACPNGLAPTTSTTMTLALGDAIAVALLERRGFSALDFKTLHPGGSLGQKLKRVQDLMHKGDDLPIITPDAPMSEAILTMTAKRFGCVGVVNGQGALIGVVTDGDLRRHMGDKLLTARVGDIMTGKPVTIRPKALAAEALEVMNRRAITLVFAVDQEDRPVGVLHVHDCLNAGIV